MIWSLFQIVSSIGFFFAGVWWKKRDYENQAKRLANIDWSKVQSIDHGNGVRFERVEVSGKAEQ